MSLAALASMASNRISAWLNERSDAELQDIAHRIAENVHYLGSGAYNSIRTAFRTIGSERPEARSASQMLNQAGRRHETQENSNSNRESIRNSRRWTDEDDTDNQEIEGGTMELDFPDAPLEGQGAGGGGGAYPKGGGDNKFLQTPTNRWQGPGIYPTNWHDKRQFTIKTPLLQSENLELVEGKVYNLLNQKFHYKDTEID